MQETLKVLRGLQELDQDLYRVKDELRRLPQERDRRRAAIDAKKHTLAELDAQIHTRRTEVKELEDLSTIKRQRLRKVEGEAATARDAALLAHYQVEKRTLKRDLSESDDEGLAILEQIDALTQQRDALRAEVATLEDEFAEYSGHVEHELAAAEARREVLEADRRSRMTGPIAPDVLDTYEKLLDAREGQALAQLDGRICQGCYVTVPSNVYVRLARCLDLVVCPSCGRILYLPEGL